MKMLGIGLCGCCRSAYCVPVSLLDDGKGADGAAVDFCGNLNASSYTGSFLAGGVWTCAGDGSATCTVCEGTTFLETFFSYENM